MKIRQCPNCGAIVSARKVAAYSYDLVCANCQHSLEVSDTSRNLAAFVGLAAGAIAWWIASLRFALQPGALGWVLPVFLSYLVASVVAALILALEAKLRLKVRDPGVPHVAVDVHAPH